MPSRKTEIAVGMDGCVYKPSFSCEKGHKYPKKNYISKLMIKGKLGVNSEINNYLKLGLNEIDPAMNYFISQPEECSLTADDTESFRISKRKCNMVSPPYYAINYLDGGDDLFVIIDKIYDSYENSGSALHLDVINDYLFAFNNVLEGVSLLNENGIYHLDIKPDNIVLDMSADPPRFKLVDFGNSRTVNNPPTNTFGTPTYIPPEMYMFAIPEKNITIKNRYEDFFKKVANTLTIPINNQPPLSYYESLSSSEKYIKADIWALGMTLLDIYNAIMAGPYPAEKKNIYQLFKTEIIDRMLETDVDSRLTIQETLDLYNDFLNELIAQPTSSSVAVKPILKRSLSMPLETKSETEFDRRMSVGGRKRHILSRRIPSSTKRRSKKKSKKTKRRVRFSFTPSQNYQRSK